MSKKQFKWPEEKRIQSREYGRIYRERHRVRLRELARLNARKWRKENPELARAKWREANKKRYWSDPQKSNRDRNKRDRENRPAYRERLKRHYFKHHDEILAKQRILYAKNPDRDRFKAIGRKYGIVRGEYESMLERQNYVCAICGGAHLSGQPLHVDHCHKTGKVRGLLCMQCNGGLGNFADDFSLLQKAMTYLQKHTEVLNLANS